MSGPFLFLLLCITTTVVVLVIFTDWHEAKRLNLKRIGGCMALKIGETVQYQISPTNAAGAPAPVFDVRWEDPGENYDVSVSPDGLTATFVAIAAGAGAHALVSAVSKGGASLSDQAVLPEVEAPPVDEEAVLLNLAPVV
jgi:hypothetical protein